MLTTGRVMCVTARSGFVASAAVARSAAYAAPSGLATPEEAIVVLVGVFMLCSALVLPLQTVSRSNEPDLSVCPLSQPPNLKRREYRIAGNDCKASDTQEPLSPGKKWGRALLRGICRPHFGHA